MVPDFTIIIIFCIFIFKFIFPGITDFYIFICSSFVKFFFLILIIFIACSLKDSQNFFIQPLPLYTSRLLSILLNEDIVDTEKPDGICSLTFIVDKFSELFLHSLVFSFRHSKSA